ncbi:hypothetical protein ACQSIV_003053, partial [Escherichia coli]
MTALTDNTQGATGLELYEVYNNGYCCKRRCTRTYC